ncbi:hypothetical protein [Brevibacillus dissolubilis]|uniref:hypothetical protein n=1 Tax=Brevibacillus dissolubilis TaxID=1844116 RepID=UPI0011173915|nr:hypothetical protein [Brevibacillus dissolubilis]
MREYKAKTDNTEQTAKDKTEPSKVTQPVSTAQSTILQMQKTIGNRAVQQLLFHQSQAVPVIQRMMNGNEEKKEVEEEKEDKKSQSSSSNSQPQLTNPQTDSTQPQPQLTEPQPNHVSTSTDAIPELEAAMWVLSDEEELIFMDKANGIIWNAPTNQVSWESGEEITNLEFKKIIWKSKDDSKVVTKKLKEKINKKKKALSPAKQNIWTKLEDISLDAEYPFYFKNEDGILYRPLEDAFYNGSTKLEEKEKRKFQSELDKSKALEGEMNLITKRRLELKPASSEVNAITYENIPVELRQKILESNHDVMDKLEQKLKQKADERKRNPYKRVFIPDHEEDITSFHNMLDRIRELMQTDQDEQTISALKGISMKASILRGLISREREHQTEAEKPKRLEEKISVLSSSRETLEPDKKLELEKDEKELESLKKSEVERQKKEEWWDKDHSNEATAFVQRFDCLQEISACDGRTPFEIALYFIKVCEKVELAERYLERLQRTKKAWPHIKGLDDHLKKMCSSMSITGFKGAVPEVEVAASAIYHEEVEDVTIGGEIFVPGKKHSVSLNSEQMQSFSSQKRKEKAKNVLSLGASSNEQEESASEEYGLTQEIDVMYIDKANVRQIREVKADIAAFTSKYMHTEKQKQGDQSEEAYPNQLIRLNKISEDEMTKNNVVIVCHSTTGWMEMFYTGAIDNVLHFPNLSVRLGETLYTHQELLELKKKVDSFIQRYGGKDEWKKVEFSMDWKTPEDFEEWAKTQ